MLEYIVTDREKLSQPSSQITFMNEKGISKEDAIEVIEKLKKAFEDDSSINYIAAPQIGIQKRAFAIKFESEIKVFLNPIITKKRNMKIVFEDNLSFPGKEFVIARPSEISAVYYTEDFKYEDNKFLDSAAGIFDKLYQMLDGDLPCDLGLESDIETDGKLEGLTDSEIKEVISIYKQYIQAKQEAFEKSINQNKDLKNQYNDMRFTESVINGRTVVVEDAPEKSAPSLNREQRRAIAKQSRSKSKNKFRRG